MTQDVSRRALLGAAAIGAGAALAGLPGFERAARAAEPSVFGPAPGVALLSRNENPYGPSPKAIAAMAETATKGCYYADAGVAALTKLIAQRFGVSEEQVVLGEGSTEVLSAAALALSAKGAILCPELFWDTTVNYAEKKGAKIKRVPLKADMSVDLAAMEAAVTSDVGLVHICNPNNPTGMLLTGASMRDFVKTVGPKATVLVDEAYNELTDDPDGSSVAPLVREGANLIVCRTFSKIYGMAGLRVGYAITTPELAAVIRSYLMSFGGNTMGLAAALASYNDQEFMGWSKGRILSARQILLGGITAAGLEVLPSQANFLFVKVPNAEKVRAAMAEKQIMIRGIYGKWTQWSRVSTGKLEDVQRYAELLPQIMKA
jgi:histidinol-phosphate aminotransferase